MRSEPRRLARARHVPRSGHADVEPADTPTPPAANRESELLALLRDKWIETLGGIGALGGAIGGLGFLTLRSREELMGFHSGLTYPKQEWLLDGFDALGSLLWRGLSVLASDYAVLRHGAWALLVLIALVWIAKQVRVRAAVLLALLALSAALLLVGTALYRVALAASPPAAGTPREGFRCPQPTANLSDRAAFETCSWLVNDSPQNDARRRDLNGLLGWLLAACATAIVVGWRERSANRGRGILRWALISVHALLAILLLGDLPRAYAIGKWGLSYPQVQILDTCRSDLGPAIHQGNCWAFDVSAGAEKKLVYLTGSGCPPGFDRVFVNMQTQHTDGSECLAAMTAAPRILAHGP